MLMTIKDMIQKQKTRSQEAAESAQKEIEILEIIAAILPEGINPDRIHRHTLYGSKACVSFGDNYPKDTRLTMQDVARLLDVFPVVQVWNIKDGCLAMRPDWDVKDSETTENAVSHWGVMIDVEPGINSGGASQHVKWFTELKGVRFQIQCELRPDNYPVHVSIDATREFGREGGKVLSVKNTTINARGSFWADQRTRWSQASREYAHQFTIYWLAIDDSQGAGKAWLETICGENFPPKTT